LKSAIANSSIHQAGTSLRCLAKGVVKSSWWMSDRYIINLYQLDDHYHWSKTATDSDEKKTEVIAFVACLEGRTAGG
jgi:hypothetical protein